MGAWWVVFRELVCHDMEGDFLLKQLEEEKTKLEEAKKLVSDLERDIVATKERMQVERDLHEGLIDRFEQLSKETANIMKENGAKAKKMKDQQKKDMKQLDKKTAKKKK